MLRNVTLAEVLPWCATERRGWGPGPEPGLVGIRIDGHRPTTAALWLVETLSGNLLNIGIDASTAIAVDQTPHLDQRSPVPCLISGQTYSATMSNEQISLPYFVAILVIFGLIIRYLFFGGPSPQQPSRSPEAFLRSREIAVGRIQQMFPQAERRSILWDLQRNGGNIQNTTERILAGRLDTVCHYSPRPTHPTITITMDTC